MSNPKLSVSHSGHPFQRQVTSTRMSHIGFGLSLIPIVGGLSIIRESERLGDRDRLQLGWVVFALSLVSALGGLYLFPWLLQVGLASWIKLRPVQLPTQSPTPLLTQVDFNACSKHDLVRVLDIPIAYANDIELMRHEGYVFTHTEELMALVGMPESLVARITPQLVFAYDVDKDEGHTWQQVNFLTVGEMVARGVDAIAAQKIVEERESRGDYRSAVDVKKRTGLAFRCYQSLV